MPEQKRTSVSMPWDWWVQVLCMGIAALCMLVLGFVGSIYGFVAVAFAGPLTLVGLGLCEEWADARGDDRG